MQNDAIFTSELSVSETKEVVLLFAQKLFNRVHDKEPIPDLEKIEKFIIKPIGSCPEK